MTLGMGDIIELIYFYSLKAYNHKGKQCWGGVVQMINVKYAIKGIQPQFLQMQDLKNITGQEGFAQFM